MIKRYKKVNLHNKLKILLIIKYWFLYSQIKSILHNTYVSIKKKNFFLLKFKILKNNQKKKPFCKQTGRKKGTINKFKLSRQTINKCLLKNTLLNYKIV